MHLAALEAAATAQTGGGRVGGEEGKAGRLRLEKGSGSRGRRQQQQGGSQEAAQAAAELECARALGWLQAGRLGSIPLVMLEGVHSGRGGEQGWPELLIKSG